VLLGMVPISGDRYKSRTFTITDDNADFLGHPCSLACATSRVNPASASVH
jgi:hypothetical protein